MQFTKAGLPRLDLPRGRSRSTILGVKNSAASKRAHNGGHIVSGAASERWTLRSWALERGHYPNRVELREDETELDDLAIRGALGAAGIHFIDEEQWGSRSALAKLAKKRNVKPTPACCLGADRISGEPQDDKSVAKAL